MLLWCPAFQVSDGRGWGGGGSRQRSGLPPPPPAVTLTILLKYHINLAARDTLVNCDAAELFDSLLVSRRLTLNPQSQFPLWQPEQRNPSTPQEVQDGPHAVWWLPPPRPGCSRWWESVSGFTRDPRRRKTWGCWVGSGRRSSYKLSISGGSSRQRQSRSRPGLSLSSGWSGYVIGILMMAIIIVLGVGITLGYFYKR